MDELIELLLGSEKMSLTEDGESTFESASFTEAHGSVMQVKRQELSTVKWWSKKTRGSKKDMEGLDKSVVDFHKALRKCLMFIIPV